MLHIKRRIPLDFVATKINPAEMEKFIEGEADTDRKGLRETCFGEVFLADDKIKNGNLDTCYF